VLKNAGLDKFAIQKLEDVKRDHQREKLNNLQEKLNKVKENHPRNDVHIKRNRKNKVTKNEDNKNNMN
jgi:hypothetical protein